MSFSVDYHPNKAQILRVMDFAHQALVDDVPLTKRYLSLKDENEVTDSAPRDTYYKDVPLFKSQGTVDRVRSLSMVYLSLLHTYTSQLVDDLAMTLDLDRADLKIVILCHLVTDVSSGTWS